MRHLTLTLALAAPCMTPTSSQAIDLPRAWELALNRAPSVQAARMSQQAATEASDGAQGRLRPQLVLQSSQYQLDMRNERQGLSSNFQGQASNTQLSARQALYRAKDSRQAILASMEVTLARWREEQARSEVCARVADAWIEALAARATLAVTQRGRQVAAGWLEQEQARLRAGESTLDAVADIQATQQMQDARSQQAQAQLDARLMALSDWLGGQMTADELDAASSSEPSGGRRFAMDRDEHWQAVLTLNPELQQALHVESMARQRTEVSRAEHLPTVDASASVGQARNDGANNLGLSSRSAQIGIQFSMPLYAGGSTSAQVRQNVALEFAAQAEREALQDRLQQQLRRDWADLQGQWAQLDALKAQVAAAKASRTGAVLGLAKGLRTRGDVARAELLLGERHQDWLNGQAQAMKLESRVVGLTSCQAPLWQSWASKVKAPSLD